MDVENVRLLKKQILDARSLLQINRFVLLPDAVIRIKDNIQSIAGDVVKQYPYISSRLLALRNELFLPMTRGYTLECATIGQVVELCDFLIHEAENPEQDIWSLIHPRIQQCSKQLYLDGHCTNAATDAFIEINERLKNIFKQLSPNTPVPDGAALMNTIFSANRPILKLCDLTSQTGEDKQKGLMMMAAGAMSALRNPKSHANSETVTSEEAMRRLMFASMLMYQIDEAVAYSNVTE